LQKDPSSEKISVFTGENAKPAENERIQINPICRPLEFEFQEAKRLKLQ
jgi:hypothetical protein